MKFLPLGLLVCGLVFASAARLAATPADTAFETVAKAAIEDYVRLNPESATQLGDHRFDGQLTDYSAAGLKAATDMARKHIAALDAIDRSGLTGANRVDIQILKENLEYQIFSIEEEKQQETNPRSYNQSFADCIYALTARESVPVAERLHAIAQRLAAMPAVVEAAKANLKNPASIKTQTAIDQLGGAIGLIRDELEPLLKQAPEMRAEVAPAQAKAVEALMAYQAWLKSDLLPRSTGDFRLGEKLYRQKLRFALSSDLTPEEILTRAEAELKKTNAEMYAVAKPLYDSAKLGSSTEPAVVIKAVLNHLAEKALTDETIVPLATENLKLATEFVRQHEIVTVPETPVKVIVAPEFNRGAAVAYCEPPGALEPQGETFYAIAPTPADWPESRKKSFYREYNAYMLYDLTVHEAMPGHYLQGAHANQFKAPTIVRALWYSGTFAEGWAVYTEKVMAHAGFGGPEVHMQQLKMRLRATINAILDQKIHMGTMTEQEAIDLMTKQGYQEEGEAVGKWKRARLTSTQLSTYFVGAIEHDDLRAAAEKKWGAAFNLKKYNDTVISFGSPPVKFVRQEMGL
jgi:uncharacterized protein (DUF885 family)